LGSLLGAGEIAADEENERLLAIWREVIAPESAEEGARDDAPRSPGAGDIARCMTQAL